MSDELQIIVGHVYRAKKPAAVGMWVEPLVNDRVVLWLGTYELQYDGPSVKRGGVYPRLSIEKFRKWAERDVTDELPKGEWAQWSSVKKPESKQ